MKKRLKIYGRIRRKWKDKNKMILKVLQQIFATGKALNYPALALTLINAITGKCRLALCEDGPGDNFFIAFDVTDGVGDEHTYAFVSLQKDLMFWDKDIDATTRLDIKTDKATYDEILRFLRHAPIDFAGTDALTQLIAAAYQKPRNQIQSVLAWAMINSNTVLAATDDNLTLAIDEKKQVIFQAEKDKIVAFLAVERELPFQNDWASIIETSRPKQLLESIKVILTGITGAKLIKT